MRQSREHTIVRIEAGAFPFPMNPATLWQSREVVYHLVWREFKVRYRQTELGVLWAWIQPLLGVAIFTIFLGRVARFSTSDLPYSVLALSGLVPWTFFFNCVQHGGTSLLENEELITRIYLPRDLIPLSIVVSKLLDLFVGFILLSLWILNAYPIHPRASWLMLPVLLFLLFTLCVAMTLLFSAICVRYRDIKYIIPFLLQIWFFATPIAYPVSIVSADYQWIFWLNPVAGIIEGIRGVLFSTSGLPWKMILSSFAGTALSLLVAIFYFHRTERKFADII